MTNPHNDDILWCVTCLDNLVGADRVSFMHHQITVTGGTFVVPEHGDRHGSHLVEISLHGVYATGMGPDEAIRNWIKAAKAALAVPDNIAPPIEVLVKVHFGDGSTETIPIPLPGDTPLSHLMAEARKRLALKMDLTGKVIRQVSVRPGHSRASVAGLSRVIENYRERRITPAAAGPRP